MSYLDDIQPRRAERVIELLELATAMPDGFTRYHMSALFGDPPNAVITNAIHDLRMYLSEETEGVVNLPSRPNQADLTGPWLYRLVGDSDDITWWIQNRLTDSLTRFKTIQALSVTLVRATNGRTAEGRQARTQERSLRHLIEDLEAIG